MKKFTCTWKSPFKKCKFTCLSSTPIEDSHSIASIPSSSHDMYPQVNISGEKGESSTKDMTTEKNDSNVNNDSLSVPTSVDKNFVVKSIKSIRLDNAATLQTKEADASVKKKVIRSKVALKPGRSLMDWIRLGTSGKDLTGVGGKFLDVTEEELKKHNTRDDAWLCVKGIVYNVTHYGEYHPGGVEELEKGFGKDATKLFMEAHSWVNYDSMLKKCVVGRLVPFLIPPFVDLQRESVADKNSIMQTKNGSSIDNDKNSLISYDWRQSDKEIVIELNSNWPGMKNEFIIIDIVESKELIVTIYLEKFITYIHLDLEQSVLPDPKVVADAKGKVDIVLNKVKFTKWNSLGTSLALHNKSTPKEQTIPRYRSCKLIKKNKLTSNTFLFTFEFVDGCRMKIPVASHVWLKLKTNEGELQRSYTPIPAKFLNSRNEMENDGKHLHLLIKIYPDGILTPYINQLAIADVVETSDHFSSLNLSSIISSGHLVLLAAGTGVTPMLSILHRLLLENEEDSEETPKVTLMFFNKTESDILCKDELNSLAALHKSRLSVSYVLSQPDEDWRGYRGRVNEILLGDVISNEIPIEKRFFCVCGPTAFNQACSRIFKDLGYDANQVHVFPNN